MRFSRIGLLRYGALTDTELLLRPDARLHVVYGANEAGKSSALSAISDLLFGFPERTDHSFLHDAKSLRIAATLSGRDGASLSFRRRKGRKDTLLADDEAEKPLSDSALAPYLGSLDRTVFERAFGLNSLRLRRGADEMLQAGGEIGSLLFSAASGMMGLSKLRRRLDDEADAIYAPRKAANRSFYQAVDRYEAARQSERKNELKSADWKRLMTSIDTVEADLAALRAKREDNLRALARLRSLTKLEPLLAEIDRERAGLQAYETLDALPSGTAQALSQAMVQAKTAVEREEKAREKFEGLERLLENLTVDEPLLAESEVVTARFAQTGAIQKSRQDLPRVEAAVDDDDQRLANFARRLGLAPSVDLAELQPSDAHLARLRQLLSEARALEGEQRELERRLAEEREALTRHEDDAAVHLVDPAPFVTRLSALRSEVSELARIGTLSVRHQRAARELEEAVGRLKPGIGDLGAMAAVAVPDIAAITHHRQTLTAHEAEWREADSAVRKRQAELEDVQTELRSLEASGDVVTREDIAQARALRDETLASLKNGEDTSAFPKLEMQVREADRLSDQVLSDAERVSRHADLIRREQDQAIRLSTALAASEAVEKRRQAAQEDYRSLFAEAGIIPLDPEAMVEWRRELNRLLAQRVDVLELEDEVDVLRRREADLRPMLEDMADALGLTGLERAPLGLLHQALEQRTDELEQLFAKARSREAERRTGQERLAALEARADETAGRLQAFRQRFSEACVAIGLEPSAEPVMAEAALDIWREVPEVLRTREDHHRRVRGMHRDLEAFEKAVAALVDSLAPDLATLPADVAIGILNTRAAEARAASERQREARAALDDAEQQMTAARQACSDADRLLKELLPEGEDAADLLDRLGERDRLLRRLAEARERLVLSAEGQDEAAIRLALEGFDRIAASLEIERLEGEDREDVERFGALNVQLSDLRRERDGLEAGTGAEQAALERLSAESEARDLAREWVVRKLAAGLLNATMETYREAQADPVMRRAGTLFSEITGGRFRRLVQLYDENDALQLLAERESGEQIALSGLSEGTGDQLYLALRLAFIEDFARRNEPVPLIADDIFQTFDEERTAAGLTTLARTGESFQTILFTHQKSVADAAARLLGGEADIIELSGSR